MLRPTTTASDWPLPAALALAAAALAESALHADAASLPVALPLGLCATLPLAVARARPVGATAAIAVATLLTFIAYGAPLVSGAIALLCALWVLIRGRLRQARTVAAERDVVEQAMVELTARGERARIARELHDVVAHHISMISVQADTARLATPGMPDQGAERLQAIGDTARAALTEMRRLLGVLREDADAEPSRQPQPGLQQLLELIDEARAAAGASTRLIVRGRVTPLDPGVELAAYRIVQEALTNARRHAPGAAVDVELDYGDDALRVRIRDGGPGPPSGTTDGHGLLGMRERVVSVGGELHVGPAPVGGFLVEARLPA